MKKTIKEMEQFCRENNLCALVKELNYDGNNFEGALEYVYDQHTLTKDEFVRKYFAPQEAERILKNAK